MSMNDNPVIGGSKDVSFKRLDLAIGILAGIAAIVLALLVQSSLHKTELADLRTEYENQIKAMKEQHENEVKDKGQNIDELTKSVNAVSTAVKELGLAVAVRRLDEVGDMNETFKSHDQAHELMMRLLDDLESKYAGSQAHRAFIERSYEQYSESLKSAISACSRWSEQISMLLADLSQWLPAQLEKVRAQREQALEDLLRFRRVPAMMPPKMNHSTEEMEAVERHETLRRKLAELQRLDELLDDARHLLYALGTQAEITE